MKMQHPGESTNSRRTIAVIAVHGIGDQKPFETARRIGDLLQALPVDPPPITPDPPPPCAEPAPELPGYYPFHEDKIRINVNPVVVRPPESEPQIGSKRKASTLGPFNAWVSQQLKGVKATWRTSKEVHAARPAQQYDISTEFMKRQLFCYGGDKPEDTYETIRLEGTRAPRTEDERPLDVHIYELYWADLSRLKAGIFSIFTELYQLLFHLSSLGVHAINAAALDHPEESRWRWLRRSQSWASAVLTVPLPVFNLLMLSLLAVVLGLAVLSARSAEVQLGITAGLFTASLIAVTGVLLWRRMKRPPPVSRAAWLTGFIGWFCTGVGTVIAIRLSHHMPPPCVLQILESLFLFLISMGIMVVLLYFYDQRRPGVLRWGLGLSAVVLIAASLTFCSLYSQLHRLDLPVTVSQFWVREFEMVYHAATLSWILFFLLSILNCIFGFLAVAGSTGPKRDLAVRSRWTGWLMLSLPSFIFLTVTVMAWGILALAVEKMLPIDPYYPLVPWISATCIREMAGAFLHEPVAIMLPVALFFAGLAALPAIWGMAPIVWSEVVPPPAFKAIRLIKSLPLGNWLSLAYRSALVLSGLLIYLLMVLLLPGGIFLAYCGRYNSGIEYLGIFSGVLFGWLFLARGSLKKLALGFRPALDLLLDVDNWLREHPLKANPRARICGRYVSLLRYIANWKNPDNPQGYEKIVVIAHSQGTVITADLLRFLHSSKDAGSAQRWRDLDSQLQPLGKKLPITLFTMGSPLRQLYGLRFPYLYGWARHQNKAPMAAYQVNDLVAFIPLPAPDPADLGIVRWVNAFRSGDYVGRHLWRTDECSYLWSFDARMPAVNPPEASFSTDNKARKEFCIGAGAHTHYWDDTAPMIARELDTLIAS
jgi:hypothetical protein